MKLFVAGCSFSDYSKVNKVYGEHLAEKLNAEYFHEGAGCGSNDRIWRVIPSYINQGILTSEDLLVVQYTSLERREFWSHNLGNQHIPKQVNLNEKYKDTGSLIKFKFGSSQWARYKEEKLFCDLYEKYFVSFEYEVERFINQNLMFQSFLLIKNIPTVFLISTYMGHLSYQTHSVTNIFNENSLDKFKQTEFCWYRNDDEADLQLEPGVDSAHLSEYGHKVLAEDLFNHIKHTKIKENL